MLPGVRLFIYTGSSSLWSQVNLVHRFQTGLFADPTRLFIQKRVSSGSYDISGAPSWVSGKASQLVERNESIAEDASLELISSTLGDLPS